MQLTLEHEGARITFDKVMKTKDGWLVGADFVPRLGEHANPASEQEEGVAGKNNFGNQGQQEQRDDSKAPISKRLKWVKKKKNDYAAYWDINRFHKVFGHDPSVEAMRVTALA
jgi:hypothetical protein